MKTAPETRFWYVCLHTTLLQKRGFDMFVCIRHCSRNKVLVCLFAYDTAPETRFWCVCLHTTLLQKQGFGVFVCIRHCSRNKVLVCLFAYDTGPDIISFFKKKNNLVISDFYACVYLLLVIVHQVRVVKVEQFKWWGMFR